MVGPIELLVLASEGFEHLDIERSKTPQKALTALSYNHRHLNEPFQLEGDWAGGTWTHMGMNPPSTTHYLVFE
jgi:hypothetical protein